MSATSNQISSTTGALGRTYSYDAAGNVLSYVTVTTAYNDRGRLASLTQSGATSTYLYNALGQRIQQSGGAQGTVLYWYDEAGRLMGEYDGAGILIEETVWLGDIPVATLRPSASAGVSIFYVHTDQLNTPRQVTRPSDGLQMWTWFSDPFGTNLPNENPAGAGTFKYYLRFAGQVFDGAAGLHQNYFRDYDPGIGKYVESDPIGLAGGSLSTYSYTNNNPINLTDPDGEFSVAPSVIEQALARAGLAEAIGGGPEDPAADIAAIIAAVGTIVVATSGNDPDTAKNLVPVNPGRDCNGKCKPCPPNQVWSHPGDAHGSTGGTHYHGIVWNQNPATCMCYPNRVSGPNPKNLR